MNQCRAYNCSEPTNNAFCPPCIVAVSEDLRRAIVTMGHKYGKASSEYLGRVFQARIDIARYQRVAQIEIDWIAKSDRKRLRQIIRDEVAKAKADFAEKF